MGRKRQGNRPRRRARELGRGEEFFYREAGRVSPRTEDPEEAPLRR